MTFSTPNLTRFWHLRGVTYVSHLVQEQCKSDSSGKIFLLFVYLQTVTLKKSSLQKQSTSKIKYGGSYVQSKDKRGTDS